MLAAKLLASAAMGASVVLAQGGSLCSQPTITINAAADASNIPCTTVQGTLKIAEGVAGELKIGGPAAITGDLIVTNATQLISLSSSSIGSIGGKFVLQGLTLLSTLQFTALQTVGDIQWQTLPALSSLTFGSVGVTKVKSVEISDTFLSSLDGLNIATVDILNVNNNGRLVSYASTLSNVSTTLTIQANGANMAFSAPRLSSVSDMELQGLGSCDLPALKEVKKSMKFDNNKFTTFVAPNLTEVSADVSFINNAMLSNLSFPVLTKIGAALRVVNNTALEKLDGFPALTQVVGAVQLGGDFSEVTLPKLGDVKGAFNVQSTGDIKSSCDTFSKHAPTKNGGNNDFQGNYTCLSFSATANQGGGGSGGGGRNGSGNAAASLDFSKPAVLGFAALAGLAML